jgi:hypothetical protein
LTQGTLRRLTESISEPSAFFPAANGTNHAEAVRDFVRVELISRQGIFAAREGEFIRRDEA